MTSNLFISSIRYLFVDLIGEIVRFPFWWYSQGTKKAALFCWRKIKGAEESLALKVWVVNIFKPMFGQHDLQGKLISFFIRVIQIIFRSILMLFILILYWLIFVIWLVIPIFIIYQIVLTCQGL